MYAIDTKWKKQPGVRVLAAALLQRKGSCTECDTHSLVPFRAVKIAAEMPQILSLKTAHHL